MYFLNFFNAEKKYQKDEKSARKKTGYTIKCHMDVVVLAAVIAVKDRLSEISSLL